MSVYRTIFASSARLTERLKGVGESLCPNWHSLTPRWSLLASDGGWTRATKLHGYDQMAKPTLNRAAEVVLVENSHVDEWEGLIGKGSTFQMTLDCWQPMPTPRIERSVLRNGRSQTNA